MTDVAVDCLRIRGPGARRLAGVAARVLPAALERALADLEDVHLGSITIHLEPADHDDHTLAALWADAIRTQALAAGARTTRRASGSDTKSGQTAMTDAQALRMPHWSMAETVVATAAWLGRTPRGPEVLPPILLSLARPEVALGVQTALGASAWQRLLNRLGDALTAAPPTDHVEGQTETVSPAEKSLPDGVPSTEPGPAPNLNADPRLSVAAHVPELTSDSSAGQTPGDDLRQAQVLRQLGALAELVEGKSEPVDLTTVTRAGGLILLWPWLADVCREAEAQHPRVHPVRIRLQALARLADPSDPTLSKDPLIRFLAGASEGEDAATSSTGLDAIADSTLASFAALLPGFGASTPRFVRDQWVLRLGVLDVAASPALLVAATHPLDVVLSQLPYPLSLFKLPWAPMLSVRLRP